MKLTDFDFDLPEELIAQSPLLSRDSSRLLVLDKTTGSIEHKQSFKNILDYIKKGDCIVLNDTKVIPARLIGRRKETGGNIELLLLKRIEDNKWEVLTKPGKKAKIGDVLSFGDNDLECLVIDIIDDGKRIVQFIFDGIFEEILDKLGQMPLPPYITERLEDKNRYQTVYAKNSGSAAAPTAGLHFTDELLSSIKDKGIHIAKLTLHVGLGTFRPVKVDNILDHKMHSEYYEIDDTNADIINNCIKNSGKIISVGTTCTRTLESICDDNRFVKSGGGYTDIFIYPPYKFKIVDSLITNFHLPKSSLIMLTSAFSSHENIMNAYKVAVDEKYRFFSFGDAMFITDL